MLRGSTSSMMAMALAMFGEHRIAGTGPGKPPNPEMPCVVCGKPKRHNNAFCSAQCCRKHKSERRQKEDRQLLKQLGVRY